MRKALVIAVLAAMPVASHAAESPKPLKGALDVCVISYNENRVTQIMARPGYTITIQLAGHDQVDQVVVSDLSHLKRFKAGSVVWLKPTDNMEEQPISIRAISETGQQHLYQLSWLADATIAKPCNIVRFINPAEVAAERAEALRKRQEAFAAARAAQALGHPSPSATLNYSYIAQGDGRLLPAVARSSQ